MKHDIAIKVTNLHKSYNGFKAVDNLDFEMKSTECVGLLGPNGAGKTTTMKILYGKSAPDSRQDTVISVFGCNPCREALQIKALAGIVPQEDNLDEELNVTDNLAIYARFYGIPTRIARERIEELLLFMELQDKRKARVRELSGGMQRRLTIARALINKPKLLILDEPTTGLDPQVRHLIWNKLRELQDTGVTVLLSTHYMEEAFQICNRVIIMDKGKKILEGSPRELLTTHLEKYVRAIHGAKKDLPDFPAYCAEHGIRHEYFQDTLFLYSNDASKLSGLGTEFMNGDCYIRPANLEDLFLKVTGRSLNELQ